MSTKILDESSPISFDGNISLSVVQNGRPIKEDLADYVRRVRNEKGLSLRDVEVKSGGGISKGYVGQIENRDVLGQSVTPHKLQALAVGLGVSEDEIFAVARGKSLSQPEVFDSEIYVMFRGFDELSDEDKADLLGTIRMLAAEVQRRRPRKPSVNGKGGKKVGGKNAAKGGK
jgi:transcriptional regulator with XRE-family HTH domain